MQEVPPLPGEEALYEWIASVWAAADKDAATKAALVGAFAAADKELVEPLFAFKYNGRDIGHGWTVPVNASQWGTDYLNRTAISKSSMYQNTPEETLALSRPETECASPCHPVVAASGAWRSTTGRVRP